MQVKCKLQYVGVDKSGAFFIINGNKTWGYFAGNEQHKKEAQVQFANKVLQGANGEKPDVEIEYEQPEGKKYIKVTSFKAVGGSSTAKSEPKKETGTDNYKAPRSGATNSTQESIERQVAAKVAAEMVQVLAGHVNPNNYGDVLVSAFNACFEAAYKKISG